MLKLLLGRCVSFLRKLISNAVLAVITPLDFSFLQK